jgi:outer membrane protein assembly factor BamB
VAAGPIPAFHDRRGFFLANGTLKANDLDSGATTWSFTGDGTLVTATIVANGVVYVGGSSGTVYAVGETTGATVWSDTVGVEIPAPTDFTQTPLNGLAVGGDSLLVPAGHRLVCYR